MLFNKKYMLMSPETGGEGGAGGAGGSGDSGSGGSGGAAATPTLEELQKQLLAQAESIKKLTEKNTELLREKQSASDKAKEAQRIADEEARKKAELSGDAAKVLSIVQKELEEKNKLIEQYDAEKKTASEAKEFNEKLAAFKEDLKDFKIKLTEKQLERAFKEDFADKYVKDENGKFNANGRKQAHKEFLKDYHYAIDQSAAELEQGARKRDTDHSSVQKEIDEVFKLK